jgi:hypothetical protein
MYGSKSKTMKSGKFSPHLSSSKSWFCLHEWFVFPSLCLHQISHGNLDRFNFCHLMHKILQGLAFTRNLWSALAGTKMSVPGPISWSFPFIKPLSSIIDLVLGYPYYQDVTGWYNIYSPYLCCFLIWQARFFASNHYIPLFLYLSPLS